MVLVPGWRMVHPGLHFSSSCEFPKCFCWGALVGATPLHLLSQTALPLKSPTGAFIAPLRCANAVPPQTLLRTDEEELCQIDTIPPQQFMRVKLQNNARHIPRIFPEIPAAYPDHYTSHGWTSEIRYSRMERREKGTLP